MDVNNLENIAIIIIEKENQMLPVHVDAFELANGSRKSIEKQYLDSIVIRRNGAVKKVVKIDIQGPYGQTWYGRLFSYLNSSWEIKVHFTSLTIPVNEIKAIICKYLALDSKRVEPFLNLAQPYEETIKLIDKSNDMEAVFEYLNLFDESEILDVL